MTLSRYSWTPMLTKSKNPSGFLGSNYIQIWSIWYFFRITQSFRKVIFAGFPIRCSGGQMRLALGRRQVSFGLLSIEFPIPAKIIIQNRSAWLPRQTFKQKQLLTRQKYSCVNLILLCRETCSRFGKNDCVKVVWCWNASACQLGSKSNNAGEANVKNRVRACRQ